MGMCLAASATEYNLQSQRQGYGNAFNDAGLQSAIASFAGGIAVTYIEWPGSTQQSVQVAWRQITNAAQSSAFAADIAAAPRVYCGLTAPGSAINYVTPSLLSNAFEGARWVIEVSGDGTQNDGSNTAAAHDAFLAPTAGASKAINGRPVGGGATLSNWYDANVVGGTNSFLIAASDFTDFDNAVKQRIARRIINQTPEPGSLALLGLALAGVALVKRRKNA